VDGDKEMISQKDKLVYVKSVEFSDNPLFTNPVCKNVILPDRNKNDYAKG
jgi:hypothetical protein